MRNSMKKNYPIIIGAFFLLACHNRTSPVDPGSEPSPAIITAPSIDTASKGAFDDHIRLCLHANDTITANFKLYRSISMDGPFEPINSFPAIDSKNCFDDVVDSSAVFYYRAASIDRLGSLGPLCAVDSGFLLRDRTVAATVRAEGFYDHNALYWNTVAGAREYAVYRSSAACPDGMTGIARTTSLVYRDSVASIGKFFYAVAVIDSQGHEGARSLCTAAGRSRVPGPSGFAVTDGAYHDSIVLSWDSIPGIHSFIIYRSSTSCPKFDDTIARTTNPQFADIVAGTGYYSYTVSGVDIGGRQGLMGQCLRGRTAPSPPPVNLKVSFDENPDFITLSWDTLGGTRYYIIFRSSISCFSDMNKIDSTGATGYTDNIPTSGIYYYRVASVDNNGRESSLSDWGRGRVKPLPAPTGVQASKETFVGRIRISWDQVLGADGYIIFKGTSNVADLSFPLDTVTSLYKFDDVLDAPLQYYWVAARNALGAGTRSGYAYGRALMPPELMLQNDTGPIVLTWNCSPAAAKIMLFRANQTSDYVCIDSTPQSPFTVTLPDYQAYNFKIIMTTQEGDTCSSNPIIIGLPIPVPVALTASLTADTVRLKWNSIPGIFTYSIFRTMSASELASYEYANTPDTFFIDTVTTPGHYYYRVAAGNFAWVSEQSDSVGVVITAPTRPASQ